MKTVDFAIFAMPILMAFAIVFAATAVAARKGQDSAVSPRVIRLVTLVCGMGALLLVGAGTLKR